MAVGYDLLSTSKGLDERELTCIQRGSEDDCDGKLSLEQCARFCELHGSSYFQYGKNDRDQNCRCGVESGRYPITITHNWDIYGFEGYTLDDFKMPAAYGLLITDKGFDEKDLKCMDGDDCYRTVSLEECADFCRAEGSSFFQYGKNERDQNCKCRGENDHHPITVNNNWDIYGFDDHSRANLYERPDTVKPDTSEAAGTETPLAIIVGSLVIVISCLFSIICIYNSRCRRQKTDRGASNAGEGQALASVGARDGGEFFHEDMRVSIGMRADDVEASDTSECQALAKAAKAGSAATSADTPKELRDFADVTELDAQPMVPVATADTKTHRDRILESRSPETATTNKEPDSDLAPSETLTPDANSAHTSPDSLHTVEGFGSYASSIVWQCNRCTSDEVSVQSTADIRENSAHTALSNCSDWDLDACVEAERVRIAISL